MAGSTGEENQNYGFWLSSDGANFTLIGGLHTLPK
jgi:hypothetical protein